MKLGWIFPVMLLCGLLAVPGQTFDAASDAALLWWTRVLPSLLPYLIAATLLERSGLLLRAPKRILPLLLWLFGAVGGYPIGAKLAHRFFRDGIFTNSDARRAAPFCNLPNPVFIVSVVALGIFQRIDAVPALLIGVYGVALFGLLPLFRIRCSESPCINARLSLDDLPSAIDSGVHAILVIGGSMIFATVFGTLIKAAGLIRLCSSVFGTEESTLHAWLLGLCEMTGGIRAVVTTALPLRTKLAFCAAFIQFGGCSVLLQTASQIQISLPRYAAAKLILAVCSGVLTFLITPLFCRESVVPTFASRTEIIRNSYTLLSVIVSASLGLFAVFTLTFGLSHAKKAP